MKTKENKEARELGKKSIALFMMLLIIATTFAFVMPMKEVEAGTRDGDQKLSCSRTLQGFSCQKCARVGSTTSTFNGYNIRPCTDTGSNLECSGYPANTRFDCSQGQYCCRTRTSIKEKPAACRIDGTLNYNNASKQIGVDVYASNTPKVWCTLKCGTGISNTYTSSLTFGAVETKDVFEWNAGDVTEKVSCTVTCKYQVGNQEKDCGSVTATFDPKTGTVTQPAGDGGSAWWQIPCLKIGALKPKTMPGKWGPFSSWVDTALTLASLAWATIFTIGLGGEVKCVEEQPLEDDACEECEADPLRVCTSERCAILGANCVPVERDDGKGYHCFKGECNDTDLAKIESINFTWYAGTTFEPAGSDSSSSNQLNVKQQLPWNVTQAFLSIKQDKEAKCRYIVDTLEANFSDMNDFDENEKYPTNQSIDISMSEFKTGEHYIFIKCRNKCDVVNPAEDDNTYVKFKIAEIPEGIPPIIEYINPMSYSFIDDRQKNLTIEMWLNENVATKAGCVYSTKVNNLTSNWSQMIPFEEPHGGGNNSVVKGWCTNNQDCRYIAKKQCAHCFLNLDLTKGYEQLNETLAEILQENFTEMNLSELLNTENGLAKYFNFMFRCQDTNGNKNEGDPYSILTIPPYNVYVIEPENLNETYERENIPIEVETSSFNATGGNVSRSTYCRYKVLDGWPKQPLTIPGTKWDDLMPIDELLGDRHIGKTNKTLNPATYTMFVRCRDLARIEIANWSYFKVLKDAETPILLRMYHDTAAGDYLIVETNEASECVYGTSDTIKCNYNFTDGSAFTTTDKYLHAAYWQLGSLYYVKCKDRWDNYPGNRSNANVCTAIIDPYEVPSL